MPHQPDDETSEPAAWPDVFLDECRALNPAFATAFDPLPGPGAAASQPAQDGADPSTRLDALNRAALSDEHSALCLSGGGIRSASFAVGVIQGLARHGVLEQLDYLSTVSGGGFAGSWLSAWLYRGRPPLSPDPQAAADARAAREAFVQMKAGGGQPGRVEPWPLSRLRKYTRYMSPETGALSADFWTLVITVFRNLILNWLVILPLLAAALLVPRFQFALIHLLESEPGSAPSLLWAIDVWTRVLAIVAFMIASVHIVANLPSYGNRGATQRQFILWCLLPFCLGTLAMTYYWAMWTQFHVAPVHYFWIGAVTHAAVWIVVGFVTGNRPYRPRTWMAALAAGAFAAFAYDQTMTTLFNYDDLSKVYVTSAFPLVLAGVILQAVVFVGLSGTEATSSDLEWWSRTGSWLLIAGLTWFAVCLVIFGGPDALRTAMAWSPHALGELLGITALLGVVTSWLARPAPGATRVSLLRTIGLALSAPAFVVLVVVAVASFNEGALRAMARSGDETKFAAPFQEWRICRPEEEAAYSKHRCHPADGGFAETSALFAAFLGFGLVMSRLVPANKFSLHNMYHHRITRAFLGSSRATRQPNPFTGFDPNDDIEFSRLTGQRPFHIVNATLNTTVDSRLSGGERRALSFTFSPHHVGASGLGYRPSSGYAFNPLLRIGVTLGSAVTISGAAASAAMGELTTPALGFILGLFNARLGVWLGNPGVSGRSTWRRTDPKAGIGPIVREMLGLTIDANPYVYLSDGGHFDNLGLWEMIQRRCRFVIVVDAECDPRYTYASLASAIRQIRIDHGVRIELAPITMGAPGLVEHVHVLGGTIRYGETGDAGTIVYIKPALTGDEPVDVLNYQKVHPAFPHESTADQWFSEAQFESYRMLGLHSVEKALADRSEQGLGTMVEQIGASARRRGR